MIATTRGIVAAAAHAPHLHSDQVSVIGLLHISDSGQNRQSASKTQKGPAKSANPAV
jgi:hypothetical protein